MVHVWCKGYCCDRNNKGSSGRFSTSSCSASCTAANTLVRSVNNNITHFTDRYDQNYEKGLIHKSDIRLCKAMQPSM